MKMCWSIVHSLFVCERRSSWAKISILFQSPSFFFKSSNLCQWYCILFLIVSFILKNKIKKSWFHIVIWIIQRWLCKEFHWLVVSTLCFFILWQQFTKVWCGIQYKWYFGLKIASYLLAGITQALFFINTRSLTSSLATNHLSFSVNMNISIFFV